MVKLKDFLIYGIVLSREITHQALDMLNTLIHQDLFFRKLPTLVRETSRLFFNFNLDSIQESSILDEEKTNLECAQEPDTPYTLVYGS